MALDPLAPIRVRVRDGLTSEDGMPVPAVDVVVDLEEDGPRGYVVPSSMTAPPVPDELCPGWECAPEA